MHQKRLKLIYFSLEGSDSRELSISWGRIVSILSFAFVVLVILAGSSVALFTDFYHNLRVEQLENSKRTLTKELNTLNAKVLVIDQQLKSIEKENDNLRIFAELSPLDEETRMMGVGGMVDTELIELKNSLSPDIAPDVISVRGTIDEMTRRVELWKKAHLQVESAIEGKKTFFSKIPSIKPVDEGWLSSAFGYRIDPFTEKSKFHEGLDFVAELGTKVAATAAGTVIKAKNHYKPGSSYGKEVIIDHGNGLKTRYAHLSKVLVKKNQKIKRWDIIGEVGSTGRSSGPHLHYEILKGDAQINPYNYIINN